MGCSLAVGLVVVGVGVAAAAAVEGWAAVVWEGIVAVAVEGFDHFEDQEHRTGGTVVAVPALKRLRSQDPRGLVEGVLEQGRPQIGPLPPRPGR